MTYFEKNKPLLSPVAIRELNTVSHINAEIFEEIAENGQLTARITTDKKSFLVHNEHNPSTEAEQWVRNIETKDGRVFLILGFGLGYHIEALVKKCQGLADTKIIVVEPFSELLNLTLQKRDLSELLSHPTLHLIPANNEHMLMQQLHQVLPMNLLIRGNVSVQLLDSLVHNLPIYVDTVRKIRTYLNSVVINRNTVSSYSISWTRNVFENLISFLESKPVGNLFGKFKDIPVILVAAGPSLDKNIHLLPQAKGKSIIISVGTALKSICSLGIEPDFVFSIDASEKQLEMVANTELKEARLCYIPAVYPRVPELFPENKFVMDTGFSVKWLERIGGDVGMIKGGPSVANFAFDFAKKTGANPIIMIGQDLALSDSRTHATGTIHENNRIDDTTNLFKVDSVDGGKVFTRRDFLSMLTWFQEEIEQADNNVTVIDATEGGALIPGTEVMTFQKALNQYVMKEHLIAEMINTCAGSRIIEKLDIMKLKQEINDIITECKEVRSLARKGYQNGIQLQALFTKNLSSDKKLARIYDKIIIVLKEIKNKSYFSLITSVSLAGANNRLEETIVAAKKHPHLSREWGTIFAKGYQNYFEEIEEVIQIIEPLLTNTAEYLK